MERAILVCEKCYTRYKKVCADLSGTRLASEGEMCCKRCGDETCYDPQLECGVGYLLVYAEVCRHGYI